MRAQPIVLANKVHNWYNNNMYSDYNVCKQTKETCLHNIQEHYA